MRERRLKDDADEIARRSAKATRKLVEKHFRRALDERVNLKHAHRQLQAVAKVLIVTTFLEDALRVLITFSVQQQSMRIAGWRSPFLHSFLPCLSFVVQLSGSLAIVAPGAGARPIGGDARSVGGDARERPERVRGGHRCRLVGRSASSPLGRSTPARAGVRR